MPAKSIYEAHLLVCAINGHATVNPSVSVFDDSSFDISFTLLNLESHFRVNFDDLASIRIVNKKYAVLLSVTIEGSALYQQWAEFFAPLEKPEMITVAAAAAEGNSQAVAIPSQNEDDNDDDDDDADQQEKLPRLVQIPCCTPLPAAALSGKQIFVYLQMLPDNFNSFRSNALPLVSAEGRRRRASVSAARATSASVAAGQPLSASASIAREFSLFSTGNVNSLLKNSDGESNGAENNTNTEEEDEDGTQESEDAAANSRGNGSSSPTAVAAKQQQEDGADNNNKKRRRSASFDIRAESVGSFLVGVAGEGASQDDDVDGAAAAAVGGSDDDEEICQKNAKKFAQLPPTQDDDDDDEEEQGVDQEVAASSKKKPNGKKTKPQPKSKKQNQNQKNKNKKQVEEESSSSDDDGDLTLGEIAERNNHKQQQQQQQPQPTKRVLRSISTKPFAAQRSVSTVVDRSIAGAATSALAFGKNRRRLGTGSANEDMFLPPLPHEIAALEMTELERMNSSKNNNSSKLLPHLSSQQSNSTTVDSAASSIHKNNQDDDSDSDDENEFGKTFAELLAKSEASKPSLLSRAMAQKNQHQQQQYDEEKTTVDKKNNKKKPAPKRKTAAAAATGGKKATNKKKHNNDAAVPLDEDDAAAAAATEFESQEEADDVGRSKKKPQPKSSKRGKKETTSSATGTKTSAPSSSRATKQETKKKMTKKQQKEAAEEEQHQQQHVLNVAAQEDYDSVLAGFDVPTSLLRPPTATAVSHQTKTDDNNDGEDDLCDAAAISSGNTKTALAKKNDGINRNSKTVSISRSKVEEWVCTPDFLGEDSDDNNAAGGTRAFSASRNPVNLTGTTAAAAANPHNATLPGAATTTTGNTTTSSSSLSMQRATSAETFQHDLLRLLNGDVNTRDLPDLVRLTVDFAEQKHLEQSHRDSVAALNAAVASANKLLRACADDAEHLREELDAEGRRVVETIRGMIAVDFKAAMQRKVQAAVARLQAELLEDAARLADRVAEVVADTAVDGAARVQGFSERLTESQGVMHAKFAAVAKKITNNNGA